MNNKQVILAQHQNFETERLIFRKVELADKEDLLNMQVIQKLYVMFHFPHIKI